LVPAYNHGSEVEALLRTGIDCRFYAGTAATLEPDEGELEALLTPAVRALLLIHYLGFPQNASRWRAWCDRRGLHLLEDAAQSWLARSNGDPVGSVGDLAIYSLYKTFGVPDGGALVCRAPVNGGRPRDRGIVKLAHRHMAWLTARSTTVARRLSALERRPGNGSGSDFALGDPDHGPSAATRLVLPRVADPDAAVRRRMNYVFLLDQLREWIPAPFGEVPDGASPFAFPVETERKLELIADLRKAGVRAIDFWSLAHPAVPTSQFAAAASRRRRTVLVPVHQELREEHLTRIARAVREHTSGIWPR
jgi:dTDP-4-amino-4,6-dideoxygalactose transaminase